MSASQHIDKLDNMTLIHLILVSLGVPSEAEKAIKTLVEEEVAIRQSSLRESLEEATTNLADANLQLDKHKEHSRRKLSHVMSEHRLLQNDHASLQLKYQLLKQQLDIPEEAIGHMMVDLHKKVVDDVHKEIGQTSQGLSEKFDTGHLDCMKILQQLMDKMNVLDKRTLMYTGGLCEQGSPSTEGVDSLWQTVHGFRACVDGKADLSGEQEVEAPESVIHGEEDAQPAVEEDEGHDEWEMSMDVEDADADDEVEHLEEVVLE